MGARKLNRGEPRLRTEGEDRNAAVAVDFSKAVRADDWHGAPKPFGIPGACGSSGEEVRDFVA
jgi:hypothetical protein